MIEFYNRYERPPEITLDDDQPSPTSITLTPDTLDLDEPTSTFTRNTAQILMEMLKEEAEEEAKAKDLEDQMKRYRGNIWGSAMEVIPTESEVQSAVKKAERMSEIAEDKQLLERALGSKTFLW